MLSTKRLLELMIEDLVHDPLFLVRDTAEQRT